MNKYTVSEYDGYALIVKDGQDMDSEEVADELNYLDKERANRDKTLSDIAEALGLEKGDADGIGAAIEDLVKHNEYLADLAKSHGKDAARYRGLFPALMRSNIEAGEAYLTLRIVGCPPSGREFYDAIDKALAAGEAGK